MFHSSFWRRCQASGQWIDSFEVKSKLKQQIKYAIMSDIHGNLGAFKRAVADAKKRKCQKIICLGDLTGYGKQSKECVEYAMQGGFDETAANTEREQARFLRSETRQGHKERK